MEKEELHEERRLFMRLQLLFQTQRELHLYHNQLVDSGIVSLPTIRSYRKLRFDAEIGVVDSKRRKKRATGSRKSSQWRGIWPS